MDDDAVRPFDRAAADAGIGMPVPPHARLGAPKRVVARAARFITDRQARFNQAVLDALADQDRRLDRLEQRLDEAVAQTASEIAALNLAMRRALPPEPTGRAQHTEQDEELYERLQDEFRGEYDDIVRRLAVYLPDIDARPPDGPVVDIGAGRGEWLDLLRARGVDAYGIDTNRVAVERARVRGFEVVEAEALDHLAAVEPGSLAAVTAFHVVEHLSFDDLVELLRRTLRALRPGGVLVVETPNPMALLVGAGSFHLDPTHVRPLPARLLEFTLAQVGFDGVETRFLHPFGGPAPSTDDPMLAALAEHVLGPRDYAVLARRPTDRVP